MVDTADRVVRQLDAVAIGEGLVQGEAGQRVVGQEERAVDVEQRK